MFKTIAISVAFTFSVSFCAVAQEVAVTAAVEKPAENRLEVETADLAQPAGKGVAPKTEPKGTVSRKLGKLTKEQREAVKNLDKEYARLLNILQVRIELLKKERSVKIAELVTKLKEQTTTATTPADETTKESTPSKTEKEKTRNTRPRVL